MASSFVVKYISAGNASSIIVVKCSEETNSSNHYVRRIFDLFLTKKHQDHYQLSRAYLGDATEFVYAAENRLDTCSVQLTKLVFHHQVYQILVQIASIHFELHLLLSILKG